MPAPHLPQVVIAYTLGIAAMLMAFAAVPANMGTLQWATVFMIGFFLYGPQVCPLSRGAVGPLECMCSASKVMVVNLGSQVM